MWRWLLILLPLAASPAWSESVQVEVDGTGATREAAIAQGLVEAIQQVTGVAVAANQEFRSAVVALADKDTQSVGIAESAQSAIAQAANGVIHGYRVIQVETDEPGHVVVQLAVEVEKFQPKGLGNENRRRIAVAPFVGSPGQSGLSAMLQDRVTSYLTQARRFAVVDRMHDAAYAQEMTTLLNQAPVVERVRIGQVIGADYLVVGTVRQAGVSQSERTIGLTGERITSASSSLEVDYSVLEIATRQLKWTGTVRLGGGGDALAALVDGVSARIANDITQSIFPLRLIRFDNPAELIVNQGAGTLTQGQRFRALLLGEKLVDPYTNESLGQTEREIGVVEIQRVDPKVSYGRLVSGTLPSPGSEVVLRPAVPVRSRSVALQPVAAPLIKLPGDR